MRLSGLLIVLALVVSACGSPAPAESSTTSSSPKTTSAGPAADLEAARQLWSANGPDTYWVRLVNDCGECDPSMSEPQTIVVWAGQPTGPARRSVESMFTDIDAAIAQGRNVEVSYHPELGHPTEISIDMQDRAFDGGRHLIIEYLGPGLPGEDVALDALEEARALWHDTRPEAYEFRTTTHCECEIDGTIRTRVDGDRIVDWEVVFADESGVQASPITIDEMFDDLAELLSAAEGIETDGLRITGSAVYHPELGYPTWIGLDIEVLDPDSELAFLPPRLVFANDQFTAVEPADDFDPVTDVDYARTRWEDAALASYRYELRIHDIEDASYTDPYLVTVVDGTVDSVEYQGRLIDDPPSFALPITMLFDLMEDRVRSGDTVEALYHDELGYPVFVSIEDTSTEAPEVFSIHELTPNT